MTATVVVGSRVATLAAGLASLSVLGYATTFCPITSHPATLASIGVGPAGSGVTGACLYLLGPPNILFSNISLAGSSASGTTQPSAIDPNNVEIEFEGGNNTFFIRLTDPTAGDWNLTGTQQFTLDLSYTGSGIGFLGFGYELSADASGGGTVLFDSSVTGDSNPIQVLPTLSVGGLTFAGTSLTGSPANPPDTIDVTSSIQVQANNGAANLTSADTVMDVIPEPITSKLIGSGLLAFGMMLRCKRKELTLPSSG